MVGFVGPVRLCVSVSVSAPVCVCASPSGV